MPANQHYWVLTLAQYKQESKSSCNTTVDLPKNTLIRETETSTRTLLNISLNHQCTWQAHGISRTTLSPYTTTTNKRCWCSTQLSQMLDNHVNLFQFRLIARPDTELTHQTRRPMRADSYQCSLHSNQHAMSTEKNWPHPCHVFK